MKGVIFTIFNDMIEEAFGLATWDALIGHTQPDSGGVYTTAETYPDGELLAYVSHLSTLSGIEVPVLVHTFGRYLLKKFASIHPEFFEKHDARSFLRSVHDVIHVEVKKLHPDVVLPEFEYEEPGDGSLVMHYLSPRGLCALAEGLIEGAAEHYATPITVRQSACVHDGADHCVLRLEFESADVRAVA